ncbi:alpha/beta hydrolase [Streptacidiphilus sp. PB12-B1b]|uniref:alpha/beta fold hydrolase n=1 Tax=Streptacidiphilus sp. PB12-B1b TaxID=2705012 RepID=UPI0015FA19E7|nr:alpha/beta hydrolase [Streptacidiphilus sp. PB12-B1b]QMU78135.1 alpha/beta hydrolase [Streptacidiphilus sp. PB12-B1b]
MTVHEPPATAQAATAGRTGAAAPRGSELLELRGLALLHARAQGIEDPQARQILDRIVHPWGELPGSWGRVWNAAGDRLAARGLHLDACRHYAVGRFPYPGDEPRTLAQHRCVASFERWRGEQQGRVGRLEVTLDGGRFAAWTAGLDAGAPRPLLVVLGGIVSVKEQWAPLLALADDLGLAIAVTELPGVGENTLRYDLRSPRMLSALLDALADRADVHRTAAIALSFGGHLALRCALNDPRITAVATVGAPLRQFFEDRAWQRQVPATTVGCLARAARVVPPAAFGHVRGWGLTDEELRRLRIPVHYVASLRDEIVPLGEVALLRRSGVRGEVTVFDDVHGAPAHLDRVRGLLLGAALEACRAPAARLTS